MSYGMRMTTERTTAEGTRTADPIDGWGIPETPAVSWLARERPTGSDDGDAADPEQDLTPAPATTPPRRPTRAELMADTSECDALEELGDEITTLSAHIASLECERLVKIAEFDRRGGWLIGGYRNCAEWLACRTGLSDPAARERVRVAGALIELPLIRQAMAAGRLSFSQVRALTRVATPENEAVLVLFAEDTTAAQLEKMVRGWKLKSPESEEARELLRYAARNLTVVPDANGLYRVYGSLPPEIGALLMRAIEAAVDALYKRERAEGLDVETTPEQRRADALGLLMEIALAVGFGGLGVDGDEDEDGDAGDSVSAETETADQKAEDSGGCNCGRGNELPISGTRAERYQVVMHMDLETLQGLAEPSIDPIDPITDATQRGTRSDLADGTRVSAETIRRFLCDGSIVPMVWGPDGVARPDGVAEEKDAVTGGGMVVGDAAAGTNVKGTPHRRLLNVGRKRRTIPPALRRALHARDGGCRFPGCGLRFCEGHHIVHWSVGGETRLTNLVLLCRHHHHLVHHEGFRVERRRDGSFKFFSPEGLPIGPGRPRIDLKPGDAAARIIQERRRKGIRPDPRTLGARFEKEHHIPTATLFAALEAMG